MKGKIIKNTLFSGVETLSVIIINFFLMAYMIHKLGSESYGIFSLLTIFTMSGYLSLLQLGIQDSAIKYIAEYYTKNESNNLNRVINTSLVFFSLIGIISGISLFLFTRYLLLHCFNIPPELVGTTKILFYLVAVQLVFQFPSLIFSAILEGLQRYDVLKGIKIFYNVLYAGLIFLLLNAGYGLLQVGYLGLCVTVIYTVLIVYTAIKLLPSFKIEKKYINFFKAKELFKLGGMLFLSRIIGLIFNHTDKILIGVFLTVSVLTEYDITVKLHQIILILLAVSNSAIVPAASQLEVENDKGKLQNLFIRGTKYSIGVVLPIIIVSLLVVKSLLIYWVGENFVHLTKLAQLFLIHIFLTATTGIGSTMLVGLNKLKPALKLSLGAAIFNLIFSISTVKILGLTGLILGTVLAYILIWYPYVKYLLKVLNISYKIFFQKVIIPPYMVSVLFLPIAILGIKIIPIQNLFHLVLTGGFLVSLYYIGFYFIGLEKDEQKYILNILSLKEREKL